MTCRNPLLILLLLVSINVFGQQDVQFHLSKQFLNGQTVIKVKRDFDDPYLWVLVRSNKIYRINSVTFTVDDYTPQFAAFNSFQFIDIAGANKDTVFVATNSTNVIEYKAGATRLIGSADGIPYTVNSIGIEKNSSDNSLLICTDQGFITYDIKAEKTAYQSGFAVSKVYDATWRREMFKDSTGSYSGQAGDTILYQPVQYKGEFTIFLEYLWEGGKTFGYPINTAYEATAAIYGYDIAVDYTNLFWGTNKGLFQNRANYSVAAMWGYAHYLDGINVNKVTGMYGLVAFGDGGWWVSGGGLTQENLLIGTDVGLYFSNSIYAKFNQQALRPVSLSYFSELGNIRVNDICVNTATEGPPICEDGAWVACDNGLYLIKPDYSPYLNNQQSHTAYFKNIPDSITSTELCAGTSTTALINPNFNHGSTVQWYANGLELPGKSQDTLLITSAGDYYALLYDPCENTHLETNHLKVQVISAPVFSFNYPDKLQYCDSTQTTLKTDVNPQYHYRWYTNGVLNGDTTYNYTVTQSGKYKVEVSACTNSWVPSKEIEVDLINLPVPAITADKPKYCAGDQATLTLNVQTSPGYTINWYQNGNVIPADQDKTTIAATTDGTYSVTITSTIAACSQSSNTLPVAFMPSPVFTFNYPDKLAYCSGTPVTLTAQGSNAYQYRWYKDGALDGNTLPTENITQSGKYKVEVSSCEGSWVPSKEVQVDIISIPAPVIKTDKGSYCAGDNATLSIPIASDPSYTINWYKDNALLTAHTNQTSLSTTENGNYTVTITSNEKNTDGSVCSQTSPAQNITFNPLPTVSIQQIVKTTLCDGQTVDLKVSYSDGTVKWSTGENADQITLSTSGSYSATVTSLSGCTSIASIDVSFFPNPILAIPNAGVCLPSHKTATLTAPPGMTSYVWNNQAGAQTFTVDHPQTVTLTVTDANGCQSTQDIQVFDECPDIVIPNAFTPNGDGVNDTWDIPGLVYDPTALVRVFTRYGQEIYESRGYNKPWDGTSKGKQLPSGTYYYIINAKNGAQTYSGSVAIIY